MRKKGRGGYETILNVQLNLTDVNSAQDSEQLSVDCKYLFSEVEVPRSMQFHSDVPTPTACLTVTFGFSR